MTKAFETFDSVAPDTEPDPTTRRLKNDDGKYDWPDHEVTNGVAGIEIRTWGDDPSGAWVRVVGPDRDAVTAAFHRARQLVLDGNMKSLFGGDA